jgi:methyl-accepting chemotaxis protein
MQAGSRRAARVIDAMAAVSETSAAGAEEVSAATEEQSVGTHGLALSAEQVAVLAGRLQNIVRHFVLGDALVRDGDSAPTPLPLRVAQ